jgi:hypothetical protein
MAQHDRPFRRVLQELDLNRPTQARTFAAELVRLEAERVELSRRLIGTNMQIRLLRSRAVVPRPSAKLTPSRVVYLAAPSAPTPLPPSDLTIGFGDFLGDYQHLLEEPLQEEDE